MEATAPSWAPTMLFSAWQCKHGCCFNHWNQKLNNKSNPKFRFPAPHLDPERFLKWLTTAGRLDLLSLPLKKLEFLVMCQQHFEKKYILRMKLSIAAILTLNLPEAIDVGG